MLGSILFLNLMDTSDLTTGLQEQERIRDVSNRKYEKLLLRVYFFYFIVNKLLNV